MRKITIIAISLLSFVFLLTFPVFAQDNHTAREEKEGKVIWEELQTKQITCDELSDGDFGVLGEYYMGQMVGDSHEAMNTMMGWGSFGLIASLFWIVILVDLILIGVWLWKKITKEKK